MVAERYPWSRWRQGRPQQLGGTSWISVLCGLQFATMIGSLIFSPRWYDVLPSSQSTRDYLTLKKSFIERQNPKRSSIHSQENGVQASSVSPLDLLRNGQHKVRVMTDSSMIPVSSNRVGDSLESSMQFPMGNRSIILPERRECPALVQEIPWRSDLREARPSLFGLKINPECPFQPASLLAELNDSFLHGTMIMAHTNMPQKRVTVALLYYQDMALLSRVVDNWLKWESAVRDQFAFLIIDDGSQVGLRAMDLLWPHRQRWQNKLHLTVYEVEQDIPWNIGGCRNLANLAAKTPFVLTTDTDVEINGTVASYILQLLGPQNNTTTTTTFLITADRLVCKFFNQLMPDGKTFEPHPAVMLVSKAAYWAVGGCDEDLVGNYGQTDLLFLWKADRDPTVRVQSVSKEMQELNLYVRKIWKPESNQCVSWARKTCQRAPTSWRKTRPRILKYNMKVFGRKKRNEKPFSYRFLRFRFHQAFP